MSTVRLRDVPDWSYLLKEYYEFYRYLPSGGSAKIRSHQRAVREAIGRVRQEGAPMIFRPAEEKPAVAHLRRALDEGRLEKFASLIRSIDAVKHTLCWQYGYESVPKGLAGKYAFAEFAGPYGPVVIKDLILGVVLFAPGTTYPNHAHQGISESYICLSGAISENDEGVLAPGSLLYNPPGKAHRITTATSEPSLLAYAWHGAPEELAQQKMEFSRVRDTGKVPRSRPAK
ncbi:MAG: dimethylsulfonioproprionate lyase family protein [Pseudomonadota bacterium]